MSVLHRLTALIIRSVFYSLSFFRHLILFGIIPFFRFLTLFIYVCLFLPFLLFLSLSPFLSLSLLLSFRKLYSLASFYFSFYFSLWYLFLSFLLDDIVCPLTPSCLFSLNRCCCCYRCRSLFVFFDHFKSHSPTVQRVWKRDGILSLHNLAVFCWHQTLCRSIFTPWSLLRRSIMLFNKDSG